MRNIFAFILFITVGHTGICSTSPVKLDTALIYRQARSLVKDPRIIRSSSLFFNNIQHINDSTFYYNPEGTLHLFKVTIDSATHVGKISKTIYHGHNFGRDLHLHDSVLYSLGGSGLFGETPDLLYFNQPLAEWLIAPIQGVPLNIGSVVSSWLYADTLSVIYHSKHKDSVIYAKINLKTKVFRCIGAIKSSEVERYRIGIGNEIFNNGKYAIWEIQHGSLNIPQCRYDLFVLQYGEYLRVEELELLPCIDGKSTIYIQDDTIIYRNTAGEVKKYLIDNLTIYTKTNYFEMYQSTFQNKNKSKAIARLPIVSLIISLVIFVGFIIFKKKRKLQHVPKQEKLTVAEDTITDADVELSTIENHLINLKGQTISRDKLDEIFAITHQFADTMKSNRSIKIRKINERQNNITITRKRNTEDKRYFEYVINITSST